MAFYTFDNVHDFLDEVNVGNGLADLLCHYVEEKIPGGKVRLTLEPEYFVDFANYSLPADEQTSLEEIQTLLKYHHPKYRSQGEARNLVFSLDEKGNISQEDPILLRIIQIRNAYITETTDRYAEIDETKILTIDKALRSVVPQHTPLIRVKSKWEKKDDVFNVSDILNTHTALRDDPTGKYSTSYINVPFMNIFVQLLAFANDLYNTHTFKIENNKEGGESKEEEESEEEEEVEEFVVDAEYIKTDLLDKYFNAKPGSKYFQGEDTKFYLNGEPFCDYKEIDKNLNLTARDKDNESIKAAVRQILGDDFPTLTGSEKNKLIERYILMYAKKPRTQKYYTALELLNYIDNYVDVPLYMPFSKDDGYGIYPDFVAELALLYKIPLDCLSKKDRDLLDVNTDGKTSQEKHILHQRFDHVYKYFHSLLNVHQVYYKAIFNRNQVRIHEHESERLTPGKVIRSPTR